MKKYTILLLFNLMCFIGWAQEKDKGDFEPAELKRIDILEPTAASLGRYGQYPVNYSSGSPDITIPLYTITSGELSLELKLRYNSGGIRANQESTWVGLGWDLFFGGAISRQVNGFPDEEEDFSETPNANDVVSYMEAHPNDHDNTYINNLTDANRGEYSFRQDVYTYTAGNKSGMFVLDNNNVPMPIPYSPIQIQEGLTGIKWKIIDTDGHIYKYKKSDYTEIIPLHNGEHAYNSTWYIESITAQNTNDAITFKYQSDGCITTLNKMYNEGLSYSTRGCLDESYISHSKVSLKSSASGQRVKSVKPKYIYFKNGRVTFNLSKRKDIYSDIQDGNNTQELRKLDNIVIEKLNAKGEYEQVKKIEFIYSYFVAGTKRTTNISEKTHSNGLRLCLDKVLEIGTMKDIDIIRTKASFTYHNEDKLPEKYSFDEDYWGFPNGVDNNTPIPKGTVSIGAKKIEIGGANKHPNEKFMKAGSLKSITHLTGGKSEFEWEINRYKGDPITPSISSKTIRLDSKENKCSHDEDCKVQGDDYKFGVSDYFTCDFSQNIKVHYYQKLWEETDEHKKYDRATLQIYDKTAKKQVFFYKNIVNESYNEEIHLHKGHNYRVTLTANCSNVNSEINFSYKYIKAVDKNNLPTGGLRIKSIEQKGNKGEFLGKKEFKYSPGILLNSEFKHYRKKTKSIKLVPDGISCQNQFNVSDLYYSSPVSGIYSGTIIYPVVKKHDIDKKGNKNGYTEYEYKVIQDYTPSKNILISKSWERGQLKRKTVFNNSKTPQKVLETKNYYSRNKMMDRYSKGFIAYKHYNVISYCNACQGSITLRDAYEVLNYGYISSVIRLDSTISTQYNDGNKEIKTKTIYEYMNPVHGLPTKTYTLQSDGSWLVKKQKYSFDYASGVSSALDMLKDKNKNMIFPIENQIITKVGKSEKLISATVNQYAIDKYHHIVLKKIHQLETDKPVSVNDNYDKGSYTNLFPSVSSPNAKYVLKGNLLYNKDGRIIEQNKNNDIPVCYLWGYNNAYPIAEIVGATYKEVEEILSAKEISSLENSFESDYIIEQIEMLREKLKKADVKTFVYDPLWGMVLTINPRGIKTSFEYEDFGRLRTIKDKSRNILKHYEYHYDNGMCDINISYTGKIVSPSGKIVVAKGEDYTVPITPASGYLISDVLVNGKSVGITNSYTFNKIYEDHKLHIKSELQKFTITPSVSGNGIINPSITQKVDVNSVKTFTFNPEDGCELKKVEVNNRSVGAPSSYTFKNIASNQTIKAYFGLKPFYEYYLEKHKEGSGLPSKANQGETIGVRCYLGNNGNAKGTTTVSFMLSKNEDGSKPIVTKSEGATVGAGQKVTVSANIQIPSGAPQGTYRLIMKTENPKEDKEIVLLDENKINIIDPTPPIPNLQVYITHAKGSGNKFYLTANVKIEGGGNFVENATNGYLKYEWSTTNGHFSKGSDETKTKRVTCDKAGTYTIKVKCTSGTYKGKTDTASGYFSKGSGQTPD